MKNESSKCLASPITYGIGKFKTTGGELSCSCSVPNSDKYMVVTKDNITYVNKLSLFSNNNNKSSKP